MTRQSKHLNGNWMQIAIIAVRCAIAIVNRGVVLRTGIVDAGIAAVLIEAGLRRFTLRFVVTLVDI